MTSNYKITFGEMLSMVDKREAEILHEQRISAAKERIVEVARVWATGYSGGSFNLIDAVRELEEAEK